MQIDTIVRRIEVPGAGGRAVRVRAGELVRVVDVDGGQVGDVFAPGRHARPPVSPVGCTAGALLRAARHAPGSGHEGAYLHLVQRWA